MVSSRSASTCGETADCACKRACSRTLAFFKASILVAPAVSACSLSWQTKQNAVRAKEAELDVQGRAGRERESE